MARSTKAKRAKSLKRSSFAKEQAKSLTPKSSPSGALARLRAQLTRSRVFVQKVGGGLKNLLTGKKKETAVEARERQRGERYNAIRSNLTVLRGPKQVESSWVDSIAYIRYGRQNGVAVQFHDKQGNPTAQCFYPNTSLRDYEYLRDAASKGKAIWRRFYELAYIVIN